MKSFRLKGYTYDVWIRPWKKGKSKYECLKWKTGMKKASWERISFDEYQKALSLNKKNNEQRRSNGSEHLLDASRRNV